MSSNYHRRIMRISLAHRRWISLFIHKKSIHASPNTQLSYPAYGGRPGNPGSILRLDKTLLVSNVVEGCREVEKKKPSDRSFVDVVLPLINGQLIISHLRLTSLTLPISLNDVQEAPSDLCWCVKKGKLSASDTWTYRENIESNIENINTVNSTGVVNIPQTTFSAQLNTTMGRNSDHQPTIRKVACRFHSDSLKMHFSSPSTIESNLTEMVEEVLASSTCQLISSVLQIKLNKFLSTFQTKIQLWNEPKVTLDYSLLADPVVDPVYGSINALLKGSIYVNGANALTIYPHEMPLVTSVNAEKSVTTLFSDYILNSLLYHADGLQLFRVRRFNHTYSIGIASFLKMDCGIQELCVGSVLLPPMTSQPTGVAEIALSLTQRPAAMFSTSGAHLKVVGDLSVNVTTTVPYTKINRYSSPFSLIASLTPDLRSDKSNNVVFLEARLIELNLINTVPMRSRDKVIALMTKILEEIMNKPLRNGIPLPMFMNTSELFRPCKYYFTFFNRALLLSQLLKTF